MSEWVSSAMHIDPDKATETLVRSGLFAFPDTGEPSGVAWMIVYPPPNISRLPRECYYGDATSGERLSATDPRLLRLLAYSALAGVGR